MIQLEVWGNYALLSRPELKVERVSYEVLTPSAARGIVEAIYYHPGLRWKIRKIYVMNPIRFTNIRRNEVKSNIVTRRMSRGQCFHTPYLGCREFPAAFRAWPGGPIPTIEETRDLGFMLYDFNYTDPQNITPMYFHAKLEHGVLNVADCEVYR